MSLGSGELGAQQAVADSLWRAGRRADALYEYRRVLAADSNAVRANFRVAQDLATQNVDSALAYLRNARVRVPSDPDLLFTEATYLSWARRFDEAILRYDSLIAQHDDFDYVRIAKARVLSWRGDLDAAARIYGAVQERPTADPDSRRDAAFGLAQIAAWQGNLLSAGNRYADLLADDPTDVRSLVGLAAVRNMQGRPYAADALLGRALERDSGNSDALEVRRGTERMRSPSFEASASWSSDSDGNAVAWQTVQQRFLPRDGLRLWAMGGSQRATDPLRATSRALAELGGSAAFGNMQVTAQVGARQLRVTHAPVAVGTRTEFTWRASAAHRIGSRLSVGVGVSHIPFDEIAALLARGIMLTSMDASAEWNAGAASVDISGNVLDFSDGNRRSGAALRAIRRLSPEFSIGFLARTFSFRNPGIGYFTPERFLLAELNGGWNHYATRWSLGVSGGAGIQSLGPADPTQAQWHFDGRAGLHVTGSVQLGVFGGVSTSAAASAVGAFRFRTSGASVRIDF
jgi:tetratricopeptide (TPR) repeat protein